MRRRHRRHVVLPLALLALTQSLVVSAEAGSKGDTSEELPTLDGGGAGVAVGPGRLQTGDGQRVAGRNEASITAGEDDRNREHLLLVSRPGERFFPL